MGRGDIRLWCSSTEGLATAGRQFTLATDFSGMGMAAFALRQLLPETGRLQHMWACDVWKEARSFIAKTTGALTIFDDVRRHPRPGPPLALYIVGPPRLPWARCGKKGWGYKTPEPTFCF